MKNNNINGFLLTKKESACLFSEAEQNNIILPRNWTRL